MAAIFCTFAISWRFIQSNFQNTGIIPFETKTLVYLILSGSLVGMQMKMLLFYGFLHCWLNAFAEIMRFGDKQFYNDWWNANSYQTFYRKWNVVVHQWLHQYIFSFCLKITEGNRSLSAFLVFFTSALIHEYLLVLSFGFFLPVMFTLFTVIGGVFYFFEKLKNKNLNMRVNINDSSQSSYSLSNTHSTQSSYSLGNTFMFTTFYIGWALMIMFYSMEWYSRVNCPTNDKSFLNYITPRFLSCVTIK